LPPPNFFCQLLIGDPIRDPMFGRTCFFKYDQGLACSCLFRSISRGRFDHPLPFCRRSHSLLIKLASPKNRGRLSRSVPFSTLRRSSHMHRIYMSDHLSRVRFSLDLLFPRPVPSPFGYGTAHRFAFKRDYPDNTGGVRSELAGQSLNFSSSLLLKLGFHTSLLRQPQDAFLHSARGGGFRLPPHKRKTLSAPPSRSTRKGHCLSFFQVAPFVTR